MLHKLPEPKGAAGGQRLFMTVNIGYILYSDWLLLLLVNTHGSFHCKQGYTK